MSRLLDQCSFSVGVIGIVLSQYIMLAHERWFHVWYAVVVPLCTLQSGVYTLLSGRLLLLRECPLAAIFVRARAYMGSGRQCGR